MSTITCKAAVCWGPDEPLKIEEIEVEPPRASEIRVRMICASLCHTDILCQHGFPFLLYPRILGHEGVGVVESVGEGVIDIKEGDKIIPVFLGECGECPSCVSGKTNICFKHPLTLDGLMPDGTSRLSVGGQKLFHLMSCGTWSEYMVINVNYTVKVNPSLTPAHASLFSCGFPTGYGAPWKEAKVDEGSTVAVFGLGGVGIGAIASAKMMGANKIIGVDINNKKKEKAELFGMTDFVNPIEVGKSASEAIKEMTGGLGVDYSFECSGAEVLLNEAVAATVPGRGMTILIGTGVKKVVSFNMFELFANRTLRGSIFGGLRARSDLPTVIQKCLNKEFELDVLVTHKIRLEEINEALVLMKQPDCLKIVIQIGVDQEA
ncbi:Alcohol dehydrogenase-like 7 [Acorus calamus]|uniref:Alcohol dehydrogenase-like 7 n=1 Tax=Acorus calamus TaxID=4465 RepID=A0AAV9CBZ5_ACOCL|nr:Alcohol dehydrogenase-like 7 [Acorus calamus]